MKIRNNNLILFFLAVLFGINAALITYWQTTRMTHLVDYSYQVEIAYRIFSGQIPYKDFMLVLTPGVYVVMAIVMKLCSGYTHLGVILHSMAVAFVTSVVSFFVFYRFSKNRLLAFLLCMGLLPVGHAIYPYPIYDIWATLCMMTTILFFSSLDKKKNVLPLIFFIGMLSTGAFFFKQTVGLVFILLIFGIYFGQVLVSRSRKSVTEIFMLLLGQGIPLLLFSLWLSTNNVFSGFIYQTWQFPSMAREPGKTLSILITDYRSAITVLLPIVIGILSSFFIVFASSKMAKKYSGSVKNSILILAGIFWIAGLIYFTSAFSANTRVGITVIWTLVMGITFVASLLHLYICMQKNKEIKVALLPFMIMVTLHAGFLSQAIAGSHYGMWPLLFTLLALSIPTVEKCIPRFALTMYIGSGIIAVVYCMGSYAISNSFTNYVDMNGPVYRSTKGKTAGLAAPGHWIPALEELVQYVEVNIPKNDTIAFLPGDDPFFAATQRPNTLWCSQWNNGTCDTFFEILEKEMLNKKTDWIIFKEKVMTPHAYPPLGWIPIDLYYTYQTTVADTYIIYKRPQNELLNSVNTKREVFPYRY
jgi:hypothetical protein